MIGMSDREYGEKLARMLFYALTEEQRRAFAVEWLACVQTKQIMPVPANE